MENTILETFGIASIGTLSYLTSKYFKITPFDKNLSPAVNNLYFIIIPIVIYLYFRILFGLSIFISNKVKIVAPKYLAPEMAKYGFIVIPTMMIQARFSDRLKTYEILKDFLDTYLGDLPTIVYEQSKPSVVSAYYFGLKILGLIFGWFLLLFLFERLISLLLWIVRMLITGIVGKSVKKQKVTESSKEKEKTS